MSWLEKLLPPRIQRSGNANRKSMPRADTTRCPVSSSPRSMLRSSRHGSLEPVQPPVTGVLPESWASRGA